MTFLIGLVHTGDSIAGYNTFPGSYFFQAYGWVGVGDDTQPSTLNQTIYYSTNLIARNLAIAGTRLNTNGYPDLVPMAPVDVDPIIPAGYAAPPFDVARRYIFTTAIGSNDGAIDNYATVAEYAAAVAACCVARKTAGFNLAGMCTLLPRTDGQMTEPHRTAYNALIRDPSWRSARGIDFAIDLASQPIMGDPANCTNPIYYTDQVHPTVAGQALLAPIFASGISAAIALLSQGTTMSAFTPLAYQGEIPTSDSLNRALNQLQTQITALGSAGTGSVTSVSVTTANGVSGSVATPTTTPAISLTLGAITPISVNGLTITTTTGTLTMTNGKTLTVTNDATISGTPISAPVGVDLGFTVGQTITPAANGIALTLANQTHTANSPVISAAQTWNNAGVSFVGFQFDVTSTASAANSLLASWTVGGATKFSVGKSGTLSAAGSFSCSGGITMNLNTDFFQIGNRFFMDSGIGDGILCLHNNAGTDFGRLQFGGTTSSFPSLKRSSTAIQARLADDSNFGTIQGTLQTAANATTGLTAGVLAATTNASIVITDGTGQVYRVPCII